MLIRVSAASMRQPFRPCDPQFIADVCQARCCRSSVDPSGTAIFVGAIEVRSVESAGGVVQDGRLVPVNKRCPFQHPTTHLCGVHDTAQPFGCRVSPFTINANGTLIVRNRYRAFPCFKAENAVPVYRAHEAALLSLLLSLEGQRLVSHLDAGGGDLWVEADPSAVAYIQAKNASSKVSGCGAQRAPLPPAAPDPTGHERGPTAAR